MGKIRRPIIRDHFKIESFLFTWLSSKYHCESDLLKYNENETFTLFAIDQPDTKLQCFCLWIYSNRMYLHQYTVNTILQQLFTYAGILSSNLWISLQQRNRYDGNRGFLLLYTEFCVFAILFRARNACYFDYISLWWNYDTLRHTQYSVVVWYMSKMWACKCFNVNVVVTGTVYW